LMQQDLLLLFALGMCRLGMVASILRVLLGLTRMLLALRVVIFAMSLGSGAMRLGRVLVMLRRLVMFVFHLMFPDWPTNSAVAQMGINSDCRTRQSWSKKEA
jgi:hypothetical protein